MYMLYLFALFIAVCSGKSCSEDTCSDEEVLERPCPNLDLQCIREFFAKHSCCIPVCKTPRETYEIKNIEAHIPHANTSLICNGYVSGLNSGRIVVFYINKNNQAVIVVQYKTVVTYGPAVVARYYLERQAPIEVSDNFSITYDSMTQTVTVPYDCKNGFDWKRKIVFTYFPNTDFCPVIGKGFSTCNPVAQASYKKWTQNLTLSVLEASVTKGPFYFDTYFNNNICKF